MATRSTPFGMFSGVALGEFGAATSASLGDRSLGEVRLRSDLSWLLSLVKIIDLAPTRRPHRTVRSNSLIHVEGKRVYLASADVYGQADRRAMDVQASPPVLLALQLAKTQMRMDALTAEIAQRHPTATVERVQAMLEGLWESNYLVSSMRPALTDPRPDVSFAQTLQTFDQETATGLSALLTEMENVSTKATTTLSVEKLQRIESLQRSLTKDFAGSTIQADSSLDYRGEISAAVGRTIADAANVLMTMAGIAGDPQPLEHYRNHLLERFEPGTLIPAQKLLGPTLGVEAPEGYTNPARTWAMATPQNTLRYERLEAYNRAVVALLIDTLRAGKQTVEVTDEWLKRLMKGTDTGTPYPALDVYADLVARDTAAIDSGGFQVVLRPEGLALGGRSFSRFADMHTEDQQMRLLDYARLREQHRPGAIFAELSYVPPHGRAGNVITRPALHKYEIPINVTPSVDAQYVIELSDLSIGVTEERLFLWSTKHGKEVVVVQSHMLSLASAPNVCRLLVEVSNDGYVLPAPFSWGAAEGAPYLPRVTRGKVILRPAQWILRLSDLGGTAAATADDVALWRAQLDVPKLIQIVEADNRLLVDLNESSAVDMLLTELRKRKALVINEYVISAQGELWLRDDSGRQYASEIVVPLIAKANSSELQPARVAGNALDRQPGPVHAPGGVWTSISLYCPYDRHDEILLNELAPLVERLKRERLIDRWFYVRYADPRPHLRIRFRAADTAEQLRSAVTSKVSLWANALVESGTAVDVQHHAYHPEVTRYGGPIVFEAAEALFSANSDATLLAMADPEHDVETTTVFALDTLCRQLDMGLDARLQAVPSVRITEESRALFRSSREQLMLLVEPWNTRPDPAVDARRERLLRAFRGQQRSATALLHAISAARRDDRLSSSEENILVSIMHMQVNRLTLSGGQQEKTIYSIWQQTLRGLRGRPDVVAAREKADAS